MVDAQEVCKPEYDVVILGSDMEALHVASRLPEDVAKRTLVISTSGKWLSEWRAKLTNVQATHLRTPLALHPHPSPLQLKTLIEKRDLEDQVESSGGIQVPSVALMDTFCTQKIINKLLPKNLRVVQQDTVTSIKPLSFNDDDAETTNIWKIECRSGRTITARAIIHAAPVVQPIIPFWAIPFFQSGHCSPRSIAASPSDVDLSRLNDTIHHVVIIGGGMSSALLALAALEKNTDIKVTLICRRPLLVQQHDCDVGWFGNKHLNQYWQCTDPTLRLKACKLARGKASITPSVYHRLLKYKEEEVDSRLAILDGYEVDICSFVQAKSSGFWDVSLKKTCSLDGDDTDTKQLDPIDAIWLACGSSYNVDNDPLLKPLVSNLTLAGYPVAVDDESCLLMTDPSSQIAAPLYLIGRHAMLAMGPTAGDLPGMRMAATRIIDSLKKLDYAGQPEYIRKAALSIPKLTAQLQATTTLSFPLEEEGLIYIEPKPKLSKTKPLHLIDISDLDPMLPKKQVEKYSFMNDGFQLTIVLELAEAVSLDNIRHKFTERSLEMWAIGSRAAYRVHVPSLYGRVLPERCKVKVNEKKKKVYLILFKESDADWQFLKS